jgi:hypothetical protein
LGTVNDALLTGYCYDPACDPMVFREAGGDSVDAIEYMIAV